ncbi:MAG TPA: hypothetical protein VFG09_09875 [Thermodesulfovibrionales bacterium]|jgi:hypothetical protein|nr:hypothetical protein [Thermodesulfovibrionales bacterium]
MFRIATQILIGLMLIFGVLTLAPRFIFHVRAKNVPRALYLLMMILTMLFFGVLSFHYAYSVITE